MKLFIVARHNELIPEYKKEIKNHGFQYSKENPDIILSIGGDGTFLVAEKDFSGVPKLLLKETKLRDKFSPQLFEPILKQIKDGKYRIDEWIKIECTFQKHNLTASNDIIIRNQDQRSAIRFRVIVDNIPIRHEYIGDGVVVSTPWGSTGYFYSITKRNFKKGIGIALNNTNTERREIIVKENSKVEIIMTRGDATLTCDNSKKEYTLKEGDRIILKKHKKESRIVTLKK